MISRKLLSRYDGDDDDDDDDEALTQQDVHTTLPAGHRLSIPPSLAVVCKTEFEL